MVKFQLFQGQEAGKAATNVTPDPALEPALALEPRVGVIFNKKSNRKQEKYQRWPAGHDSHFLEL